MANLHSALAEEAKSEARAKTAFVLATFYVSLAAGSCLRAQPTVVLFVVDGLQNDAAQIAAANGATHLKFFLDHGVRVEEALCTSPSAVVILPDSSRPWGTAAPPNVAMHTGTHVFESRAIDDVFLAARRSGIRSVFAGSADNYNVFTSADFHHARSYTDSFCVAFAVEHLVRDTVRLFSIHLQELRRAWKGPAGKVDPLSSYQQSLLHADRQLGRLIDAVKSAGRWESTYVVIASDHGMGTTERSDHPASEPTSWRSFMCFYGPGIRQGATIPYAETPDIAVFIAYVLNIGRLRGHADTVVTKAPKGVTGTLLSDLFEHGPREITHPLLVRRYLEKNRWAPEDRFSDYRSGMLELLGESH